MLAACKVSVVRGGQVVLDQVDLVVDEGSRIGVLGRNGAGKSTLLRVLAGLEPPTEGAVEVSPPRLTVGYLPQEPDELPGETVAAFLRRRTGVAAAEVLMESTLAAAQERPKPAELAAYDDALARFLALGGDDHDAHAPRVLAEVGLDHDRVLDLPAASLSGGERVKLGLAAILLARFDVLLLDEPTNNLDFDGLDRLERFVTGERADGSSGGGGGGGGVVLVSHDRAFLTATTTRVAELDLVTHRLSEYGGGYESYLEERRRRRAQAYAHYEAVEQERTRLEASIRRRKEWSVSKRGMRMTDPDKALAGRRRERATAAASGARALERRIEQLGTPEKPWEGWELRMSLKAARRSGDVVSTLSGASVRLGDFQFGPVDLDIAWLDRLAVTGPNGAGKTTLLHLLTGELAPDAGLARLGSGVVVGYLGQDRGPLAPGTTASPSRRSDASAARSVGTPATSGSGPPGAPLGSASSGAPPGSAPTGPPGESASPGPSGAWSHASPPPGGEAITLLERVRKETDLLPEQARSLLAKFDLNAEHAGRSLADLSPGERSRASLAILMARGTNLLILDEPTNHLDLDAVEELEAALGGFDGTLLVVTHDRRMLASLRVTRRLAVSAGKVSELPIPATP